MKVAQVKLRVFQINGSQNIDLAGIVKEAQDAWSKQSNGTIQLLWDHSIPERRYPCARPNCETGYPSFLLNILPYSLSDLGGIWDQTTYLLQKFPNRHGINVVHNATIPNGAMAMTMGVPLPTYQQFANPARSNIIVIPDMTAKVLGHEVGHVWGFRMFRIPLI